MFSIARTIAGVLTSTGSNVSVVRMDEQIPPMNMIFHQECIRRNCEFDHPQNVLPTRTQTNGDILIKA